MKILQIIEDSINSRHIEEIADVLRDGGIIVYPTDTVYAIGCDALNNQAIERICSLKAMKSAKTNLSIICSDISEVSQYAKFDNTQFRLMKSNLPGHLLSFLRLFLSCQRHLKVVAQLESESLRIR